ncbi:hypothetical protein [Xanthomonas axonopodis]
MNQLRFKRKTVVSIDKTPLSRASLYAPTAQLSALQDWIDLHAPEPVP